MLILNSVCSLTGFDEESPVNMERFKATVDKFTDLKKTLSYPEHESPGSSPQISRKKDQKKTGISVLFRFLSLLLLVLCGPETPKLVLWQMVKTQMKWGIMQHFIRVCTVC